jgi:hypothetical protein
MQPTLEELLNSKIYVKSNVSFMPPKELVNNFLESIKYTNEDIAIKVQNPIINENVEGGENIAYPRFLVEVNKGISPLDPTETDVIGLLVAMDQLKPLVKIYSGTNASACLNLSIFNASNLLSQDLLNDLEHVWKNATRFSEESQEKLILHNDINNKMNNTMLTNNQVNMSLGKLLRNSNKEGLGTSPIVNASKLLNDRRSMYYFDPEQGTSLKNFYGSVTQGITDSKDLLYKPNKSLAVTKMFKLILN